MMEELQDYLVSIDSLGIRRRLPEYGESYVERLLIEVRDKQGVIYIAEEHGIQIGCGACIIQHWSQTDLYEHVPAKTGRITELHIVDGHRSKGIGRMLMTCMEDYFKEQECIFSRTEVLSDNKNAYDFYQKLGYQDRFVDVIKKL